MDIAMKCKIDVQYKQNHMEWQKIVETIVETMHKSHIISIRTKIKVSTAIIRMEPERNNSEIAKS